MTTFFNVDVETSALDPWSGRLLTVGIKPVIYEPDTHIATLDPGHCYLRLNRTTELLADTATGQWGDPTNERSSYGWWIQQSPAAQDEAWRDENMHRYDFENAAELIADFVTAIEPDPRQRIFVANPVSFDKPWLTHMFATTGVPDPFHYQSLCLRSMKFGLRARSPWGATRDNHTPTIAHHALFDAEAQALDLIDMLHERDHIGDH